MLIMVNMDLRYGWIWIWHGWHLSTFGVGLAQPRYKKESKAIFLRTMMTWKWVVLLSSTVKKSVRNEPLAESTLETHASELDFSKLKIKYYTTCVNIWMSDIRIYSHILLHKILSPFRLPGTSSCPISLQIVAVLMVRLFHQSNQRYHQYYWVQIMLVVYYVKTGDYNHTSGTKFVIKKVTGVRKQLLIMSGTPILAFVTNGEDYIFLKEPICSICLYRKFSYQLYSVANWTLFCLIIW